MGEPGQEQPGTGLHQPVQARLRLQIGRIGRPPSKSAVSTGRGKGPLEEHKTAGQGTQNTKNQPRNQY